MISPFLVQLRQAFKLLLEIVGGSSDRRSGAVCQTFQYSLSCL